jgi:hypothetical protein
MSYTPTAAHTDGYLDGSTGVGPWTTILAQPSDGFAHLVSILSGQDLHLITLTVTGTDAEGRVQTEAITAPNATTVYSTKYFATLTRVSASATLSTNTMDVGWTEACVTPAYPTGAYLHGAHGLGIAITAGALTYTAQQSNDQVYDYSPIYWNPFGVEEATWDQALEANDGTSAVRVYVSKNTAATFAVTHSQARG